MTDLLKSNTVRIPRVFSYFNLSELKSMRGTYDKNRHIEYQIEVERFSATVVHPPEYAYPASSNIVYRLIFWILGEAQDYDSQSIRYPGITRLCKFLSVQPTGYSLRTVSNILYALVSTSIHIEEVSGITGGGYRFSSSLFEDPESIITSLEKNEHPKIVIHDSVIKEILDNPIKVKKTDYLQAIKFGIAAQYLFFKRIEAGNARKSFYSWDDLSDIFGRNKKNTRKFRDVFRRKLSIVSTLLPRLEFSTAPSGLFVKSAIPVLLE